MTDVQKLKFVFGSIHIEYEGDISKLNEQLPELLKTVSEFTPAVATSSVCTPPQQVNVVANGNAKIEATANSIAAKLGCSTGPDLIKAVAAHMTMVEGKQKFTRHEIVEGMKGTSYFKKTYVNNLSSYLQTLIEKKILNEVQKDTYSMNPAQLPAIEAKVA